MIRGDYFAIGKGKNVSLLCEVRNVKGREITGHVINGSWDFTLTDGSLLVHYTKDTFPATIIWAGELPRGLGGIEYEDTIAWIEYQLSSYAIVRWARRRQIALAMRLGRFGRACGAACRAFKAVYAANSVLVNDEDDLTPF
jgi:hypothetical protein